MKNNEENTEKTNEYLTELGKQIREIRNSKDLTQETLSDMAKIDTSHLSAVENGKSNVTFLTLVKIAKQLGCDVSTFSKNIPK